MIAVSSFLLKVIVSRSPSKASVLSASQNYPFQKVGMIMLLLVLYLARSAGQSGGGNPRSPFAIFQKQATIAGR